MSPFVLPSCILRTRRFENYRTSQIPLTGPGPSRRNLATVSLISERAVKNSEAATEDFHLLLSQLNHLSYLCTTDQGGMQNVMSKIPSPSLNHDAATTMQKPLTIHQFAYVSFSLIHSPQPGRRRKQESPG